jgi:Bacterial protein of unknown function (DUF885)
MMLIKPRALCLIVALVLGCALTTTSAVAILDGEPQSRTEAPDPSDLKLPLSELRGMIERYSVDRGNLSRTYPVEISSARQARLRQFYSEWLALIGPLKFEALGQDDKVDYLLLKNHLDYELRQLDIQVRTLAEAAPLVPFAQTITELEERRRKMERIDPPKIAASLTGLNKQIVAARRGVEAGLRGRGSMANDTEGGGDGKVEPIAVKKAVANRAAMMTNGLRNTLRNWFSFYNGYDPVFTWWTEAPYKTADKSLQEYVALLREKVLGLKASSDDAGSPPDANPPGGGNPLRSGQGGRGGVAAEAGSSADIVGDPIGREALMVELAREIIPYTPEELIALANKEFVWCENEMKKAARDLGYGEDWLKALEYVKTLYVEPGKQPELIRDLALEAIKFVEDHDLVTVPPLARETWRIEMMTPQRQLVNPFFTGGPTISVSYPTNTMSHEQKLMSMRGNNIHFARATVFHELIPGHHLQGFMTARYRPYRGLFSTPFWGEGWALYWELLLWDMNFPKTPENRIGMLFWRMHRCARIIFSLSFHLEKMTAQECIDLLVKRVGHEPENATAEVRRSFNGSYPPLYQAAYLLGGLQFYALHKELVDSGKMTNRAFHDMILKENRIPVEMVRALLTNQPLARDYVSNWKFYGPKPNH